MSRDAPLPLLGLSMDPSADFRGRPEAKNAGLFAALDARYGVSEVLLPEVGRLELRLHQLRRFHPDRGQWRKRVNLNPRTFRRRSARAEQMLRERDGQYRLIVQLHTLVGPGQRPGARPFVLHTDATYALTERHYPPGAPLRGRRRAEWLALEQAVYRSAAFLFPRSRWLARSFVEDYGCDPARVVVVGGGSNLDVPAALPAGRQRWSGQAALFVGMEFGRKGGEVLLAAWPAVRRALPSARLLIVGVPGEQAPGGLPAGVEWLGVVRDRARMQALYDEASVFVMPSLYEPWGHVFYEAMARGLACIGADTCAMPEIVEAGRQGLLVRPGDAEALAAALVRLLGDPGEAEAMGRAGHAGVREGRRWEDVVARMAPHLEAAMAG